MAGRLVLTYHSISDAAGPTSIAPPTFAMQMRELRLAGYESDTVDDFLAWFDGGADDGARRVLITFDDAFADFAAAAAPILAAHGLTGVVFVPTARLGGAEDWAGANAPARPLMDAATVEALHRQGIGFGGHARTHPDLTRLDDAALEEEVAGSRKDLAALGIEAPAFAPPYGATDARVQQAIARHYGIAFGTRLNIAEAGADRFDVPRIEMHYFRDPANWRAFLDGARGYFHLRRALRQVRAALPVRTH